MKQPLVIISIVRTQSILFISGFFIFVSACASLLNSYSTPIAALLAAQPVSTSIPSPSPLLTKAAKATSPTPIPTTAPSSFPSIYQLRMFSPLEGWAVSGYNGSLLHTRDGGDTWINVTPSDTVQNAGSYFFNCHQARRFSILVAQPGMNGSLLYHAADSDAAWQTLPTHFRNGIYQFLDADNEIATTNKGAAAGIFLHSRIASGG
jgi:hypothetical protein